MCKRSIWKIIRIGHSCMKLGAAKGFIDIGRKLVRCWHLIVDIDMPLQVEDARYGSNRCQVRKFYT